MRRLWSFAHDLHASSKHLRSRVDVTGPQRIAIRTHARPPALSAGELAEVVQLQPSALTGVLRRLEERRLITRDAHPGDGHRVVCS